MARRQVIEVAGLSHGNNPIPVAVRMGSSLVTGGINPVDRQTGKVPEDAVAQIAAAFANAKAIVEAGGGTMADILKVDVRLKDMAQRDALNAEWLKHFPDVHDRPVRHTSQAAMQGASVIQIEFTAEIS
ncbi:MAG TPA: Rid family hydrolase [Chloroflexota bacterium]|nr:Rid family hydrolase [Chloroflexota bacterium]